MIDYFVPKGTQLEQIMLGDVDVGGGKITMENAMLNDVVEGHDDLGEL